VIELLKSGVLQALWGTTAPGHDIPRADCHDVPEILSLSLDVLMCIFVQARVVGMVALAYAGGVGDGGQMIMSDIERQLDR
jgi:hypothetical protein